MTPFSTENNNFIKTASIKIHNCQIMLIRTWLHHRDSKSKFFFKLIFYNWCKESRKDSAQMGMTHPYSHLRTLPFVSLWHASASSAASHVLDLNWPKSKLTARSPYLLQRLTAKGQEQLHKANEGILCSGLLQHLFQPIRRGSYKQKK